MTTTASYGTWTSPVTAARVATAEASPAWVSVAGDDTWWVELRPAEGGRLALLRRRPDGTVSTVLPEPWNVRTRVQEYGGRAYLVLPPGSVVFSEFTDQRLYVFDPDGASAPAPLTPEPAVPAGARFVEPVLSPDGDEVWCVREEHSGAEPGDLIRAIVAVPLDGSAADDPGAVRVLHVGTRFLAGLAVSPDARRVAWLGWDHPHMPWDAAVAYVADITSDRTFGAARAVVGGHGAAVAQVDWLDEDTLLVAAELDGWFNLHRVDLASSAAPVNLTPRDEEIGGALWQPGQRWFAPLRDGRVSVLHGLGAKRLGILDPAHGGIVDVDTPHTEWAATLAVADNAVIGVAGSPDRPLDVVRVDIGSGAWVPLRPTEPSEVSAYLPSPEARVFRGPDGREIHAAVYPPANPDYDGPAEERPPYVVFVHGGPTGRRAMVQDLEIAYFTSRGIGVVDVNYGGSTGYGRDYRNRLREEWGVVDVEDSAAVAQALVDEGSADLQRLGIRGGSAGGFTSAAALTTTDVFACGTVMFPVLDLVAFAGGGTHDFESHYLESLIGRWPDERKRYEERSPLQQTEGLHAPFLLLQGLEDRVCPPAQSEAFLARIEGRGVPHAYIAFEGEQHGFRKEETIVRALEAELALYARVFGFEPVGIAPLDLEP